MKRIPLPVILTQSIAEQAYRNVRETFSQYRWRSVAQLSAWAKDGEVGITSRVKYLLYQNEGTKPFLMKNLDGKTIPIRNGQFTDFVTVRNVGTPGYVTIPDKPWPPPYPSNATAPGRVYRQQRWRHPGLKPKHFIQDALSSAIEQKKPLLQKALNTMLGNK
jgi:hypothetical protein